VSKRGTVHIGATSLAAPARCRNISCGSPPRSTAPPSLERACALSDTYLGLEIIEVLDAGRVRVCLRGELDLASGPRLGEVLRRLRERRESVLLDLDELSFIDMSGLRVVLAAAEHAARDGGGFAVTRGSSQVRRLIALVRPDGDLPLDGTSR